jgi:1-acyl-sn-glycerol-3-phosphate acyltransferase
LEPTVGSSDLVSSPPAKVEVPVGGDSGLSRGLFYGISLYLVRIFFITVCDGRVFGAKHVPRTGSVVLAGTHQSVLDPIVLGLAVDRRSCFLAKDSLFRVPFLRWLIRQYRTFPVPRSSVASRHALDLCVRILRAAHSLVFFPEGTRSADGKLQPLKRGLSLIVRRSGAPVTPVLISGSFACWPRGARLPRPGHVEAWIGEPVNCEESDSADSFVETLSRSYERLAQKAGAAEMLRQDCNDSDRNVNRDAEDTEHKEAPSSSQSPREPLALSKPAGDDSLVACETS